MKRSLYAALIAYLLICLFIALSPDGQHAIGAAATAVVRPAIIAMVELINVPAFVYVLATLLLIAGIIACVSYWTRSVAVRLGRLRQVRAQITELPRPEGHDAAELRPEALHQLGTLLGNNLTFVHAWAEYQVGAIKNGSAATTPFGHYVDAEPLSARDRGGLMQSLPGYFTSLGLIFTFVGLVVALYFAAKGFRSGDIQDARTAIVRLLNAASFKFLTSVAALISAFMVSVVHRIGLTLVLQSRRATAEAVEVFLSQWRDYATVSVAPAKSALTADRMDGVVAALAKVTARLDALLMRMGNERVRESDHATG